MQILSWGVRKILVLFKFASEVAYTDMYKNRYAYITIITVHGILCVRLLGSLGPISFVANYRFEDFWCRLKWQWHLINCHTGGMQLFVIRDTAKWIVAMW